MKIVVLVARILLGLIFVVFGLNGFLNFLPQPPMPPGDMLTFLTVVSKTHYMVPVFTLQILGGALLLIGRFVPLGLTLLAPILFNILVFHIVMAPAGLPPGAIATVLWFVVFFAYRQYFAGILTANAQPS